ncbi:hypothetical protein EGW08_012561, partial [Elysia chlorotica]
AITCPPPLLANFNNYTVETPGSDIAYCTADDHPIDVCRYTNKIKVDYSLCPTIVFYSRGGLLHCVYTTVDNNTYYVNLLNLDSGVNNRVNYHFTCVVVEYTAHTPMMMMVQLPRKCGSEHSATALRFSSVEWCDLDSCSFPSGLTSATWRSTRWDDLTFTSSQLTVLDMDDLGTNVIFNCDLQSGTKYLIRSAKSMTIMGNNLEIVACLDFPQGISTVKTLYYHATSELAASATRCPRPLLDIFTNYTVTKPQSNTTYCPAKGGLIDICNKTDTVHVDYSVCPTVVFYSKGGLLHCVYSTIDSDKMYYVNLLNLDSVVDNKLNYHYTCVRFFYTGSSVLSMTQVPRGCARGQYPTTLKLYA